MNLVDNSVKIFLMQILFSIILAGKGQDMTVLCKNGAIPPGDEGQIKSLMGLNIKRNELFFTNPVGVKYYYLENQIKPLNDWKWESLYTLKKLNNNFGSYLCDALGKFWEIMPNFEKKLNFVDIPELFLKKDFLKDPNEEVVFFPGSFNPWHDGHMSCVSLCPNQSKLIVVPDNNPWKERMALGCKWEKYRNLCLILKDTPYSIYSGFMGLENENPTVNWLPNTNVGKKALLMGDDSFLTLLKWKDSTKLLPSINKIYLVPRLANEKELSMTKEKVLNVNPELKIEILPSHGFQEISSTKIRGN